MAGEPTLNSGDTGDWVTYLQQLLEHLGLGSGFTPGVFDDATASVVRQAQQQYSVPVTGTCDDATWAALTSSATAGQSAQGDQADQSGGAPEDIAVSLEDEVAAPDDEVLLAELDELPGHVQVA